MNSKAKFILFIGKEEDGDFIHLPSIILDHLYPYYVDEKADDIYTNKFKKNNELLEDTLQEAESLEPGEYKDINLKVRVYRRNK